MYPPSAMSHVAINKTKQSMMGEEVADTVENQKLCNLDAKCVEQCNGMWKPLK